MRFPAVLLFLIGAFHPLPAQVLPVERLTIEDGLSQGMIFDILQTRDGFLWFATMDGLNRYDGYNFKVFSNDPFNPYSIASSTVTALFEDSQGRLWVGTESNGLDLYDAEKQRFYHLKHKSGQSQGLSDNAVTGIVEDPSGTIWVATQKQYLNRLRHSGPAREQPDLDPVVEWAGPPVFVPGRITPNSSFLCTPDGRLLIEYEMAVTEIDWRTGAARPLTSIPPTPQGSGQVSSIMLDRSGALWFGRPGGVTVVKDGRTSFLPVGDPSIPIVDMTEGTSGQVWLCSGKYVWQVDAGPGGGSLPEAQPIYHTEKQVIRIAFADKTGLAWFGTIGYGLVKYNPRVRNFSNYLAERSIWSMREDGRGRLWLNVSGRYFRLDRPTGAALPLLPGEEVGEFAMTRDPQDRLWVLRSPWQNETGRFWLDCYSPDQRWLERVEHPGTVTRNSGLLEDPAGNIWIGAKRGELLRFNPATRQFSTFRYGHLTPSFVGALECLSMVRETDGTFWIGTHHGLVRGRPAGDSLQFSLFKNDPADPRSLAYNVVLSIYPEPAKERTWVGTRGGGIGLLDKKSGLFRFFTRKDGLPDNVVYGILPEQPGIPGRPTTLWLSTNRGLSRLSETADGQLAFKNYGVQDGLPGLEFNANAYLRSKTGELMFGGVNGLTVFNPAHLTANRIPPQTVITGLHVNTLELSPGDSTGILAGAPEVTPAVTLDWNQNSFSIHFAALDFTAPGQNRYRYRLAGADPGWVEAGPDHSANYAQLPPGEYRFEVIGSNSDGVWSEEPARLSILIPPPWWRRWWAFLAAAALAGYAVFRLYRLKISRIKLENEVLFEKKEAERLAELDALKTNFFGNVTHEFRTPLTLIQEPLRQLLNDPDDPDRTEKIRLAEKNSRRLLGLVNQLLDLAKLESGAMSLDLRRGDLAELARTLFGSFLHLAARRDIHFTFTADADIPVFSFDAHKVELVLNNLISNALKFTPAGGRVAVRLEAGDGAVTAAVSDNGPGVPAGESERIFERFYQVDGSHTRRGEGTGIGLSLSRELARLLGGDIRVYSPGELPGGTGATFIFRLPVHDPDGASPARPPGEAPLLSRQTEASRTAAPEAPVVLVVEDNGDLRRFIRLSAGHRWQVVEAADGAEGFRKAVELLPDLIVSDVMMPEKDGYALCDELKNHELTAHIPVILLTARSGLEARIKGLHTGADDYLAKPFHTEELLARAENLVAQRRRLLEWQARKSRQEGATRPEDALPESASAAERQFLQRFILLIEQHISDGDLGVEEFAQKMFISRMQLHRKLKALTGKPASEFIRVYRLERAMALLKQREGNVTQVADMVGFNNEKYFSTAFKDHFGRSPSEV